MSEFRIELIAQGPTPEFRWRRAFPSETTIELGRTTATFSVPWDDQISRTHANLRLTKEGLEITRLPSARNPIFVQGGEVDVAVIEPGEHFVIGSTTFTLTETHAQLSMEQPEPVAEQQFSSRALRAAPYRNADKRIDALSRLPDLIQSASSDPELFSRVVNVLLMGVPRSDRAAIVAKVANGSDDAPIEVLHWDSVRNATTDFAPSEQLIRKVLENRESVIHVWHGLGHETSASSAYTQGEDLDWAFCTPVPGFPCRDWAIYITGRFSRSSTDSTEQTPIHDPADFQDDLKFAESAAAMLGHLREIRQLARDNAALTQFFSPRVIEMVSASDPDVVLAPRESEITVMFCDLRGFSLHAERSADDLFGLLDRVSNALGVMTRHILKNGGVVGDFQGDSVMGFWGWPLPEAAGPLSACRAALGIAREINEGQRQHTYLAETVTNRAHPLAGFGCGIGVATGKAVAGRIGTDDQVKFTAFGPVVNLASRLEGLTKVWQAPVLLDAATAAAVESSLADANGRLRRLCKVQPLGITQQVRLTELLCDTEHSALTDELLQQFAQALEKFEQGDWSAAKSHCERMGETDAVSQVLLQMMHDHGDTAPASWDGALKMTTK